MKFIKKIGLFILLSMFLCACGKEIDSPTNLHIIDNVLHWEEVEGADSYEIYINDSKYISASNSFNLPDMKKNDVIYIITIGNGTSSEKSVELIYESKTVNLLSSVMQYISGFMPSENEVYFGTLKLPEKFNSTDIQLTYKSSNPNFITDGGQTLEHEYDEEVTITCTASLNGYTVTENFTFISRGIDYSERYQKTLKYIEEFFNDNEIHEGMELPTTLPMYGGRIRWAAEDPTLIYDYKTLNLPVVSETTHLMAEILFPGSVYGIEHYEVTLPATKLTSEERAINFIKSSLSSVGDYFVLYNGLAPEINKEYLIDETDPNLVRHFFTYPTRPAVSQGKLNELMYEGYKMPNDENVLWVVIHETGNTNVGKDALVHADLQWRNAYDADMDAREASWTYTVDDHSIYQSFNDWVPVWHATDGRSEGGGNLNGIGIELCVNADNKYDVGMFNDARLVAYLLKEYNLGLMNMKQHYNFYPTKNCPENMRDDERWFEFLTLIAREYYSQNLLKDFEITYEVKNSSVQQWSMGNYYDATKVSEGTEIQIEVKLNDNIYLIDTIKE